ncbi:MAG: radical SAM protein [Chloroflexota bacterium]
MEYLPRIVSWNITAACNLRCSHCYLNAAQRWPNELTTEEGLGLIDQMAEAGVELLIITGGEPLLRKDLPLLASHATGKGITVVLGTNGTLIDRETARILKESGVAAAGISLDSLEPVNHDSFRGISGAWLRAIDAIKVCREEGLDVLVHTTALKMNHKEIPALIDFAYDRGARAFHLFFLVCTGRGEQLTDISPQEYERLLAIVLDAQGRSPGMMVRARCAPYIRRLAYERGSGLAWSAGCLAGTSYCRISPIGDVTPCPYLPLKTGNVRATSFQAIWETSQHFRVLRPPHLQLTGRCGMCAFSQGTEPICVGCRARAFALTGDLLAPDPWCPYQPEREKDGMNERAASFPGQQQVSTTQPPIAWTPEAAERLGRIPSFIRNRVKQAAEVHARELGHSEVTPEVLVDLRRAAYRKAASAEASQRPVAPPSSGDDEPRFSPFLQPNAPADHE